MKKFFYLIVFGALIPIRVFAFQANQLEVYPVGEEIISAMSNNDYTVKVRVPSGDWKEVFTYNVQVDLDNPRDASMSYFDFNGEVEVAITKNGGKIDEVSIKPLSYNIEHTVKGQTVFFKLKKQYKLSIEFNGNRFNNLHLFTNSIEKNKPDPSDPNIIYFKPGLHNPKNIYKIPSGSTVYIAGGAVVRTTFVISESQNVTLRGRGIIEGGKYGLKIHKSSNVNLQDLIFANIKSYTVFGGNTDDINIDNIKSISSNRYSDGIDLMSCNEVTINEVFMRNSDDCLAFYGHRWDYFGGAKNYNITNSILWADVAHPIFLGIHGNPKKSDTLKNFLFQNIKILEHDENSKIYQGAMAINSGDNTFIENVVFKNIVVENFEEGQLFNLRVFQNSFNKLPGAGIKNVLFENIVYNGSNSTPSIIEGYNSNRVVENVIFKNVLVNGQLLKENSEEVNILDFTRNIIFKK